MNLEQLETLYTAASDSVFNEHEKSYFAGVTQISLISEMRRAGLRAVVEALRDEVNTRFSGDGCDRYDINSLMDEILGDEVKAAGGSTSNDERGLHTLDTRPAADPLTTPVAYSPSFQRVSTTAAHTPAADPNAVCEWTPYTDEPLGANWWRTCRGIRHRYTFDGHHPCTSCGKPIAFVEAVR
jgi:hypothetical protein